MLYEACAPIRQPTSSLASRNSPIVFVYGVEGPEALIEVVSAAVEQSRSAEA
jgi:hypothetical protein